MREDVKVRFFTLLLVLTALTGFSSAEAYTVYDGQICGKRKYRCRPPITAEEVKEVKDARTKSAYAACDFSWFPNWDKETFRLEKALVSAKAVRHRRQRALDRNLESSWPPPDIPISDRLLEKIVSRQERAVRAFEGLLKDSDRDIAFYQWCIARSTKKPNDFLDCQ